MSKIRHLNLLYIIEKFKIPEVRRKNGDQLHYEILERVERAIWLLKDEPNDNIKEFIEYINLEISILESANNFEPLKYTVGCILGFVLIFQPFPHLLLYWGNYAYGIIIGFILILAIASIYQIKLLFRFKWINVNTHMYKILKDQLELQLTH